MISRSKTPFVSTPFFRIAAIGIVMIALLIRVIFLIAPVKLDAADAQVRYDPIARNLLKGNGFSRSLSAPYTPTISSQPVYPLFLAFIYRITNFNLRLVAVAQIVLELGAILLLYLTAGLMGYSRQAKLMTVAVALLCPLLPRFSREILTEIVAVFFTTLFLYASVRAVVKPSLLHFAICGAAAGLCLLVRSDLLPLVVLLIFSIAFLSKNLRGILMLLALLILTLVPWTIRNYVSLGMLYPLDETGSKTSLPYVRWLDTWMTSEKEERTYLHRAKPDPNVDYERLREEAIRQRPFHVYIVLPLIRLAKTWLNLPSKLPTSVHFFWMRLFVYAFLALSGAGLYFAWKSKRKIFLLLICLIAGRSVLPLISSVAVETRYLFEALPACFLLAGHGLSCIAGRISEPDRSAIV